MVVLSGSVVPNSFSTARGSRTLRARKLLALYLQQAVNWAIELSSCCFFDQQLAGRDRCGSCKSRGNMGDREQAHKHSIMARELLKRWRHKMSSSLCRQTGCMGQHSLPGGGHAQHRDGVARAQCAHLQQQQSC